MPTSTDAGSARRRQSSSRSTGSLPRSAVTYSITVVVPPMAAATVPVSKSSLAPMAPSGRCRWVWASMPPGMT